MGRLIAVFFLAIVALVGFFLFWGKPVGISSPISKVYGLSANPKPINEWFPKSTAVIKAPYDLSVSARSALVVNYDTGEIIFSKEPKQKLSAASTIKIMTALIALEKTQLSDTFEVFEKASKVGEDSMGLTAGEKLTVKELLYGLMLVSGNDAAIVIAEGVSGSEEAFVGLMNQNAAGLGLSNTKFINATGLDVDGQEQYTTAYDIATIAHYVWEKYPTFRQIASTEHIYIEANENHKPFDLYSQTNLLTTYPGVRGIKPGFTWEAGLCLVTYAENDGKKLLGIILGSDDRRGEMKELLDYGFSYYGIKISHPVLDL